MCEERFKTESKSNWGNWRSCLRYLEIYCDESTTFNEITPDWVKGFKKFLDTVEKDYNKHTEEDHKEGDIFVGLSQNSKVSYFNKLKACINQAFEDRIIPVNPLRGIKGFKTEEVKREYLSWDEVCKLDGNSSKPRPVSMAVLLTADTMRLLQWTSEHIRLCDTPPISNCRICLIRNIVYLCYWLILMLILSGIAAMTTI